LLATPIVEHIKPAKACCGIYLRAPPVVY
jgi:hypothetical protein